MANYKTPGVYIEEITKFPPSVAQVETAIPAFIGYTEKAEKLNGETLHMTPKRIKSLLEYETYFGSAQREDSIVVSINDETDSIGEVLSRSIKVQQPTSKSPFLMYYSLQMYFANGGGPCYILSVDQYGKETAPPTIIEFNPLNNGLSSIAKEDEPTLIVFPDSTGLGASDFKSIYENALLQCNKLQDRFTIIDTRHFDEAQDPTPIEELRDGISLGKDYLKYGAAYYPHLETILDYRYEADDITINHVVTYPVAVPKALGSIIELETEVDTVIGELFDSADNENYAGVFTDALDFIYSNNGVTGFGFDTAGPSVTDSTITTSKSFSSTVLEPLVDKLGELIDLKKKIVSDADSIIASVEDDDPAADNDTRVALTAFKPDFEGTDSIESSYTVLLELVTAMKKVKSTEVLGHVETAVANIENMIAYTFGVGVATEYDAPTINIFTTIPTNIDTLRLAAQAAADGEFDTNNGAMNGRKLGTIESVDNATFNIIKQEINALPITLPPSSAMAGIYARVDASRGVWKAPANVGLSYVVKPTVQISHDDQGAMNIDTVAGKSINAIRTFTGKGTLVWGARTLAGNDNEWRYINVRRFFNMVEESVGKATEQFVFEGNDANTWVRVRAMIENFLILQWKAGALAGAKAEQAFYVRVGLGQTMTAQDILEGRMIIEIGMAAVRPAEFIILRFSHKMQEA